MKSARDIPNTNLRDNSMEVITDGKLSDIARPTLSRGSTRSVSQLSLQNTSISFELESLPIERNSLDRLQDNELFLEEAVTDDSENDESEGGLEYGDISKDLDINAVDKPNNYLKDESSAGLSDEDLSSKELEKEIMKIAKRIRHPKNAPGLKEVDESSISGKTSPHTNTKCRPQSQSSCKEETNDVKEIDPKIQRGLEKIKKLDGILAEKMKLEKEAKADRRRMEREWQLEIQGFVEWCGENKSKPIIQQFLALTSGVGDSHSQGGDDEDIQPLFQTEVNTDFGQDGGGTFDGKEKKNQNNLNSDEISSESNSKQNTARSENKDKKGSKRSSKKNFLKRNIELASHANEIVSLTESERQRLDDLLSDDSDLLLIDNPFTKSSNNKFPLGYELDDSAKHALEELDEKLRYLVPEPDFQSICFSPRTESLHMSPRSADFSQFEESKEEDHANVKYGEGILQQEKTYRMAKERLQQIELDLQKLHDLETYDGTLENSTISNEMLRKLLDVDSRLTSSAMSIVDSARSNLSRIDTDTVTDADDTTIDTERSSFSTEKSFHSIGV